MNLESMAIELPAFHGHPNREPFRGVLTLVNTPSDRPPAGSRKIDARCVKSEYAEKARSSTRQMHPSAFAELYPAFPAFINPIRRIQDF